MSIDTECGLFQGVSREDAETILGAAKEMEKIWTDANTDGSVFDAACRPLLKIMCREISKQKKRLGGDFAVAHAVVTRYYRQSFFEMSNPFRAGKL